MQKKLQISKLSTANRRADAHKKIMLGGLIIKAGLDYFHPSQAHILYGMLLYNKKLLAAKPSIVTEWEELGQELMNKKKLSRQ